MALEKFDGTGAPIEAADWLSSVVHKLESFQVPASDWVRYAHQLQKGEALVWWRGVTVNEQGNEHDHSKTIREFINF
jgi:hypothetical protein